MNMTRLERTRSTIPLTPNLIYVDAGPGDKLNVCNEIVIDGI